MENTLLAEVSAFFAGQSVPVAPLDDSSLMITRYRGDNGMWQCIASVDEEAATFVFYSLLDVAVDGAHRAEVVELLMRATSGLQVGNFEFDYERDAISFRTSIDVEGDRLSQALVANIVATNLMVVDHYLPALERVAAGTASARDAIADAEA